MNVGKIVGTTLVVGGSIWLFLMFFHIATIIALGMIGTGTVVNKVSSSGEKGMLTRKAERALASR